MIIVDFLEKNAKVYPKRTAVYYEADNTRLNYEEILERVYRLANGLIGLGVEKGDRVVIVSENRYEWLEMYMGLGKIGAVATPLNYRLISKEIVQLVNHSEANTVIIEDTFSETIEKSRDEMPLVKNFIVMGKKMENCIDYHELLSSSPNIKPDIKLDKDELFCLLYTGGTTGKPKGVMLSHLNLFSGVNTWIVEGGMTHSDVTLVVSPLFHTGGLWILFAGFMLGNKQVILKNIEFETMYNVIEKEQVTSAMWLPMIVNAMINSSEVKNYNLSSIKKVVIGGGALGEPQLRKFIDLLGCRVCHAGGQTETAVISSILLDEHLDGPSARLGSAGKEAYNIEMKVVDENDNEVASGEVGELCARGDAVMQGYWHMPEVSAESLRGGWQHTGDYVKIDEEGYIYYVDRLKDMIKSGGENVYSKEVEDIIYSLPQVAETAVIGVPDDTWGEAVKALIIIKPGEKLSEDEIIAHCKNSLSGFKCPKSVEFVDEFPKTGLGKIAKNILKDKFWAGHGKRIK